MRSELASRWWSPCNGVWVWQFTINKQSPGTLEHKTYEYETEDKLKHDKILRLRTYTPFKAFNEAKKLRRIK